MNQEQLDGVSLEHLPYPMFETTEEEKECLLLAMRFIKEEDHNYFLCHILEYDVGGYIAYGLREELSSSIGLHFTLSDYLGLGENINDTIHAEIRRIWIRKLLEYKEE